MIIDPRELIRRRLRFLCERIATGIETRSANLGGPARAAMLEIAAVREAMPR